MYKTTYMNKENRDKAFNEIPKEERKNFVKRSMRNQLLHPMYIADYPRKLTSEECGFGNTIYQTYFKVIYFIDGR